MLCFDPTMRLRKAHGCVFCYSVDAAMGQITRQKVIHPIEAILLSLFNGKQTTAEISQILHQITGNNNPPDSFITRFIKRSKNILVEGEVNDRYNPIEFVIPNSEVENTTDFRLLSPVTLVMLITYSCSSNCQYCYANRMSSKDRNEMDYDLARRIVDQAVDCQVELLYIGGGDPFTCGWIINLIQYAIDHDIELVLSTKEFLGRRKCMQIADAGVTHMQVSIDTLDEVTADLLVGRQDFLVDVLKTVENLQSVGISVTTNSVVTKHNYRDIPELVSYLIDHGIRQIMLSRYYRSTYVHNDALFVDDADVRWLNRKLDAMNIPKDVLVGRPDPGSKDGSGEGRLTKFLNRASCAFGRTALTVTPSGKVIPCEQLPTEAPYILGDLSVDNLRDVWESDALLSLLYPPRSHFQGTACCDCEHYDACVHKLGWCIRDIYKVYHSDVGVHPQCPRSTHTMRLT